MMHALLDRRIVWSFAAAMGLTCAALGEPADTEATAEPAAATDPAVIDWLDRIEAAGRKIHAIEASVTFTKINALLGDRQVRTGTVAYQAADADADRPARFAVLFKTLVIDDALRPYPLEFIFDGRWLVEKDHHRKTFIKRQILPPGQTFDPLSIDGPMPLPIGQKRHDVLARFRVEMMAPDTAKLPHKLDKPPLHLRLTPHKHIKRVEGRKHFDHIDIWFDRPTLNPLRIRTLESDSIESIVTLANHRVNDLTEKAAATYFDTSTQSVDTGWRIDIRPWQDESR